MLRVKTYDSVKNIDAGLWNSIVSSRKLICQHAYLEAIESSKINDCKFFYPVVYDGNRIVCHACLYFISTELDLFAAGMLKRIIKLIRNMWPSFLILRSIECGTPVALGNTISYVSGIKNADALGLIISEAECVAKKNNANVLLFRDFYESELDWYGQISRCGYKQIHNLPSTRMVVTWQSLNGYIASLRSKYRNKTLARIEKLERAEISLEIHDRFAPYAEEMAALWFQVYSRAKEYRREILRSDFFANIDELLGDKSGVIIARKQEKIVGFMLLLYNNYTLVPLFCGLDYGCSVTSALYFNLFYKTIELAGERGFTDIDLGITTITPKIEMGAEVETLYMYMKHLNPLVNSFLPGLFDLMTTQPKERSRKVFR